ATSSITGWGQPSSPAKNSVWPENGMPASLIVLFCRGPVTRPANTPRRQPSTARRRPASSASAFAGSGVPQTDGTASACGRIRSPCAAAGAGSCQLTSVSSARRPRRAARSLRLAGSAITTTASRQGESASASTSSGPMPAGSPAVTTSGGEAEVTACPGQASGADVDVSLVPQPPHPQLRLFRQLAVADSLDAVLLLQVLGVVVNTPVGDLEDVPAEAGAERLGDLPDLHAFRHLLEFRHELARPAPAELAPVVRGSGIVRQQLRELAEILDGQQPLTRVFQPLLRRLVIDDLVGRDQDVPDLHLLDLALLVDAADLVHLDDVESAHGADRLRDLALLEVADDVGEDRRELVAAAPAQVAAFQAVLAVRVPHRHLAEIGAGQELLVHVHRPGLRLLDLLAGGGRRNGNQDVGKVVLRVHHRVVLEVGDALLDLARRDRDAPGDVDAAELVEHELLAHVAPVVRVVDALLDEHFGQCLERDVVLRRHLRDRGVQHLVGDLDADALRALDLDLLHHEALEHLLAQHARRGELQPLLQRPLRDERGLAVELALQHHALVDNGGDPVEEFAGLRKLVGEAASGAAQASDDDGQVLDQSHNFRQGRRPAPGLFDVGGVAKNTTFEELVRGRAHAGHALQYELQTEGRILGSVAGGDVPPGHHADAPAAA